MTPPRLLAVDDEIENLQLIERLLVPDWEVDVETEPDSALRRLHLSVYTAIVSDFRMPKLDGAAFLERARAIDPDVVCVLVTGHGDMPGVRALKEKGLVCRVILKPFDIDDLRAAIESAAQFTRMRRAVSSLRPTTHR